MAQKKGKKTAKSASVGKAKRQTKALAKPADPQMQEMSRDLRANNKATMFGKTGDPNQMVKLEAADELGSYYTNMYLQCTKCDSCFDHEAQLQPFEYVIKCPQCNEEHVLLFRPATLYFTVNSKTVDVLDSRGRGKKKKS